MSIKYFYLTGDTHRRIIERVTPLIENANKNNIPLEQIGLIVLGDFGANYFNDKGDRYLKKTLCKKYGINYFIVQGNHEMRPEDLPNIKTIYNKDVGGEVYYEEEFPNIFYFKMWGIYNIKSLRTAVLGGAYSVDKDYRLLMGYNWFPNEQMNKTERQLAYKEIAGGHFDLILSHTCPYDWRPTWLFLSMIDQDKVDNSTEKFFQEIANITEFNKWYCGHFHDNTILFKNGYMLFNHIITLDEAMKGKY